ELWRQPDDCSERTPGGLRGPAYRRRGELPAWSSAGRLSGSAGTLAGGHRVGRCLLLAGWEVVVRQSLPADPDTGDYRAVEPLTAAASVPSFAFPQPAV